MPTSTIMLQLEQILLDAGVVLAKEVLAKLLDVLSDGASPAQRLGAAMAAVNPLILTPEQLAQLTGATSALVAAAQAQATADAAVASDTALLASDTATDYTAQGDTQVAYASLLTLLQGFTQPAAPPGE